MNFYTHVYIQGNNILLKGIDRGNRIKEKVQYKPYLFFPTTEENTNTKFRTIKGDPLIRKSFETIAEARKFIRECGDADNSQIFGLTNFEYTFINDEYPGVVDYNTDFINVISLDIEVDSKDGFPEPAEASQIITAITLRKDGYTYSFGYHNYTPTSNLITWYQCDTEEELLQKFINKWIELDPDIITGYNIDGFDIPYLINRIAKVLGEDDALRLSPWKIIEQKEIIRGKQNDRDSHNLSERTDVIYNIVGVTSLDYIELIKKFNDKKFESYKLDYIAQEVLGEKKLDYSQYKSLSDLYEKNHKLYYDYNIHDAILIDKLEEKLGFIKLVISMAYKAKINYLDTMTTIRPWDVIIYNYLWEKRIVVPPKTNSVASSFVGGYVKDPIPGFYKWVVSFDIQSLYPHLIMMFNISPEKFRGRLKSNLTIQDMLDGKLDAYLNELKEKGVCVTGNNCLYDNQELGFLAELMHKFYDDRVVDRKKMNEYKLEYEKTKSEESNKLKTKYHNFQWSGKIFMNSGYGALTNQYFRWFDIRHGEAITTTGQLAIQWVQRDVNARLNKMLKTEGFDYVIASDTDSMYLNLDSIVQKYMPDGTKDEITDFIDNICKEKIQEIINESFERLSVYMNVSKNKLVMKREAIADKGIWTAPKHYILNVLDNEGIRLKTPDIKTVGIETVRSSTPQVIREGLKQAIKIILNKNEASLQKFVKGFKEAFNNMPFTAVAFPRGINGLDKYSSSDTIYKSGCPMQVRGALLYNNLIRKLGLEKQYPPIKNKDKIRFCYLKEPNSLKENVISAPDELPPELGLDKYIDHNTQFEKAFKNPMIKILDAIGWKIEKRGSVNKFMVAED